MLRLTLQTVLIRTSPGAISRCSSSATPAPTTPRRSSPRSTIRACTGTICPGTPVRNRSPNNTGLRMARGRYIAHLGHDDFWFPWHLSGLVATIEETGADWAYAGRRLGRARLGSDTASDHRAPTCRRPSTSSRRRGGCTGGRWSERVGWWADPQSCPWPIDFDFRRRAALAGKRFALRHAVRRCSSSQRPVPRTATASGEPAPIQRELLRPVARRSGRARARDALRRWRPALPSRTVAAATGSSPARARARPADRRPTLVVGAALADRPLWRGAVATVPQLMHRELQERTPGPLHCVVWTAPRLSRSRSLADGQRLPGIRPTSDATRDASVWPNGKAPRAPAPARSVVGSAQGAHPRRGAGEPKPRWRRARRR